MRIHKGLFGVIQVEPLHEAIPHIHGGNKPGGQVIQPQRGGHGKNTFHFGYPLGQIQGQAGAGGESAGDYATAQVADDGIPAVHGIDPVLKGAAGQILGSRAVSLHPWGVDPKSHFT